GSRCQPTRVVTPPRHRAARHHLLWTRTHDAVPVDRHPHRGTSHSHTLAVPERQLVPGCRARTVHATSSAPRYESAREDGMGGGAGAGCGRGRGGKVRVRERGARTDGPATATQPPHIPRQLVPPCPARTVHRTSWAPMYELADAPGAVTRSVPGGRPRWSRGARRAGARRARA